MAATVIDRINCHAEVTTLEQAYSTLQGDQPKDIPFLVWLIENPDSFLALPGRIYLKEHDYLHILLGRGMSAADEAFVIGFSMGSDPNTKNFHVTIFKFIATRFYPHPFNLELYKNWTVAATRRIFELSIISENVHK